jgi:uncharacterized protein involved in outer membrane biogenesis
MVNNEIKKATGFTSKIEGFRLVTTPKLTVGAKLDELAIFTPDGKEIFEAEKFSAKMSLLPLLAKRIEIDIVQLGSIDLKLGVNKDGSFEIEKYLPTPIENTTTQEKQTTETKTVEQINLPLGLRLSNRIPDIKIGGYDIEFIDLSTGKKYEIEGKVQLAEYLKTRGLDEGYLVTFSFLKNKTVQEEPEWIEHDGKRIYEAVI